jgi:hypothetical protein
VEECNSLLIGHIAATARQMEEARANGGKVVRKPQESKPKEGGPGDVAGAYTRPLLSST